MAAPLVDGSGPLIGTMVAWAKSAVAGGVEGGSIRRLAQRQPTGVTGAKVAAMIDRGEGGRLGQGCGLEA